MATSANTQLLVPNFLLILQVYSLTNSVDVGDEALQQLHPRVLVAPLLDIPLDDAEAGEQLGELRQLGDRLHHLGGRHEEDGGRVRRQEAESLGTRDPGYPASQHHVVSRDHLEIT